MKKLITFSAFLLAASTFINTANAQKQREARTQGSGGAVRSQPQMSAPRTAQPVREMQVRPSRDVQQNTGGVRPSTPQTGGVRPTIPTVQTGGVRPTTPTTETGGVRPPQNNDVRPVRDEQTVQNGGVRPVRPTTNVGAVQASTDARTRPTRDVRPTTNAQNNDRNRNYNNNSAERRHNNPYGIYTARHYDNNYRRPYIGQRYDRLYGRRHNYYWGGHNYWYSGGYFYEPFGSSFQVVFAPFGLRVWALPWGYNRVYIGPSMYYYYGNTYYRPYYENNVYSYEVVDVPIGGQIAELPTGAKVKVINDQKFYELNGTYYKETLRANDELWYTVVGKNGVLNTNPETAIISAPGVGDIVSELPEGTKPVVLNGQKYYVSEDDTYYQEVINGDQVNYKIVGKAGVQAK